MMMEYDFQLDEKDDIVEATSIEAPCPKQAVEEFAVLHYGEEARYDGNDASWFNVRAIPRDDTEPSRLFRVTLEPVIKATATEIPEPKDKMDHALELYRLPESRKAGMTFEQCLEFVQAVDHEADKRRPVIAAEGLIGGSND